MNSNLPPIKKCLLLLSNDQCAMDGNICYEKLPDNSVERLDEGKCGDRITEKLALEEYYEMNM
jgi:hypothetical protein